MNIGGGVAKRNTLFYCVVILEKLGLVCLV